MQSIRTNKIINIISDALSAWPVTYKSHGGKPEIHMSLTWFEMVNYSGIREATHIRMELENLLTDMHYCYERKGFN